MYWWCWCFWLANSACRTSEFECRMSECACRTSWNFEISNFSNHLFLPYHVMSKTHRAFWNFQALLIHWSHCHLQIDFLSIARWYIHSFDLTDICLGTEQLWTSRFWDHNKSTYTQESHCCDRYVPWPIRNQALALLIELDCCPTFLGFLKNWAVWGSDCESVFNDIEWRSR